MQSSESNLYVFTGTGNTLLIAREFAQESERLGKSVSIRSMEAGFKDAGKDVAVGLALPVACFSTYPTVWRFIDSLSKGNGREIYLFATMGGVGAGMEGPIGSVLSEKGYTLTASRLIVMPGNYNNKTIDAGANALRIERAKREIDRFARELYGGVAAWGRSTPIVSRFFARLAHGRVPWRAFYKIFPLRVDISACTGCGVCAKICPERNIILTASGCAEILDRCQSCQRCIAFCPAGAIMVPNKPADLYHSIELNDIETLLKS